MKFNWTLLAIWLTVFVHCRSSRPRCPLPIECHPKPIETLQHPIRCCGNEKSYFIKIIFFLSCLLVIIAVRVDAALFVCLCCVGQCWLGWIMSPASNVCRMHAFVYDEFRWVFMSYFTKRFTGLVSLSLSFSFWPVPNCRRPSK